jgi:hypothetical protein
LVIDKAKKVHLTPQHLDLNNVQRHCQHHNHSSASSIKREELPREMTETVPAPEDAAAARAAEQTRLRKERREAKIKAGASARLNKITGLGGGVQRGAFLIFSPSFPIMLLAIYLYVVW